MKNIVPLFLLLSGLAFSVRTLAVPTAPVSPNLHVDQFGYPLNAKKIAVLASPQQGYNIAQTYTPGGSLQIRRWSDDVAVFTGAPVAWNGGQTHAQSGDKVWWLDFSSLATAGSYYLFDPTNNVRSVQFDLNDGVYQNVLKTAVRVFFYQRSGFAKTSQFAGTWTDGAAFLGANQDTQCRLVTDQGNASTAKDLSGGWFDAGDYNKYVNFTYSVLTDLLLAYEENPAVWGDDYNLPESGNGVPDLLDEVKWELDWLRRMQQTDGSVLSKVSVTQFQAASPPSSDATPRYYGPASTSSTLTAAAVFALAAIQYKASPNATMQAHGAQLQTAAVNAYAWASNNPNATYTNAGFQSANPEVDAYETSARKLGAAVYLFALTGNATYKSYVDANYQAIHLMAWSYAYPFENSHHSALLYYTKTAGATGAVASAIKNTYQTSMQSGNADNLPNYLSGTDAYRAYLSDDNHTWGSNRVRSDQGNMFRAMLQFGLDAGNATNYRDAAMGYVHYLHGVNPTGYAYLSNMGGLGAENSIPEMYHSWFANGTPLDTNPAPGYVVGGPNKNYAPDGSYGGTISPPQNQPVQKSFKAWNTSYPENSWEITEPAIYYQAAYVRMLSKAVGATTPPPADTQAPSVPTNLAASNIGPTSLTLTWTASTDNVGVSAYEVFQNGAKIGESLTTSFSVTGLTPSTTYNFTVKARDAAGNTSAASNAVSVTPPDTQAPTAPTNLVASNVVQTSFTLTWTASTDNVGVTSYEVFRNGASVGTATGTSFNVTGLTANTTYSLTVKAKDAAGNASAASTALSVTTAAATASDFLIYGDALNTDWQNWSWGLATGSPNFSNTTPRKVGTKSMSVTVVQDWAGLSLRAGTALNTGSYPGGLQFWVNGGSRGTKIQVYAQTTDNGPASPAKSFDVPANAWQQLTVSWADLGNPAQIKRLNWQDRGLRGGQNFTFYLDDVKLQAGVARLAAEAENADDLQLRVAPNPALGLFRVSVQGKSDASTILRVYDLGGRQLAEQLALPGSFETTIDLRNLPTGLYLLRAEQGNAHRVVKVLVQR